MTIQGSTEVFPPSSFLRFLATTKRTGRFTVEHVGGTATALLRDGRIGTVTVDRRVPDPFGAKSGSSLFSSLAEMVQVTAGLFTFTPLVINGDGEGHETEPLLRRAEAAGADERDRTKRLAGADVQVTLSAEVAFRHLRVDDLDWAIVVAVGDGSTLGAIAGQLDQDVSEVGRRLVALAESGVVVLVAAPSATPAEAETSSLR